MCAAPAAKAGRKEGPPLAAARELRYGSRGAVYGDLAYSLDLNDAQGLERENYGVGFRKGSDLVDAFNEFWAQAVADGTVLEVATTYGLQDAVILE